MKKVVICACCIVWIIAGLLALNCIGAADMGAPIFSSYIGVVAWGAVHFASLFAMDWASRW